MAMRAKRYSGRLGKLALGTALGLWAGGAALTAAPVNVGQGKAWTPKARADFYTRDQGSRIIPLAWLRALKTADGRPFLGDGLTRYGYLPNPANQAGLPVGFMAVGAAGREDASMSCSACHTRQIAVGATEYRIDGGPALSDFQALLADLDAAVGRILADEAAFATFAAAVPNGGPGLKQEVAAWYRREHALISVALPVNNPWGLGRLDAVSMIYNRLTAMDIGPPPTFMIDSNVRVASAPVRYPLLWNAPKQDRTQWPGFAENGSSTLALARNLGEVYGVFGIYRPRRQGDRVDFLTGNSTQWKGLDRLEELIKKLGPPRWPFAVNRPLAAQGKKIYERKKWQDGGCIGCHGIKSGAVRPILNFTWATPLCDIGTDTAQYGILNRTADTGVLQGSFRPEGTPLPAQAKAFDLLGISVIGSIFQHITGLSLFHYQSSGPQMAPAAVPPAAAPIARDLVATFAPPTTELCGDQAGPIKYESRVMQGIWATAPYLHNGSVPTLADLLKPPADRPARFNLGRRYDTNLVGLARDQDPGGGERVTTGCDDLNSGNSRCGHDFGTNLSDAEKAALLEYMKIL
jgi:mono/diheme cytochrome c family protein